MANLKQCQDKPAIDILKTNLIIYHLADHCTVFFQIALKTWQNQRYDLKE